MANNFLEALLAGQTAGLQRRQQQQQMSIAMIQEALHRDQLAQQKARDEETKAENLRAGARAEITATETRRLHDLQEQESQRKSLLDAITQGVGKVQVVPEQEYQALAPTGAAFPQGGVQVGTQRIVPIPFEKQLETQIAFKKLSVEADEYAKIDTRYKILQKTGLDKHLSKEQQTEFILDRNFIQNQNWPSWFINKIDKKEMTPAEGIKAYLEIRKAEMAAAGLTPFQQIDVAGKRLAGQVAERAKEIVELESKKSEKDWGDAERARLPVIARALAKETGADPAAVIEALKDLAILNPPATPPNRLKQLKEMSEELRKKREKEEADKKAKTKQGASKVGLTIFGVDR